MKISLVIPVAPDRKAEVLDSLQKVDYPSEKLQIIVVKGKNPSINRNKGAERADGDIIGFLDDDAVVDENILKEVKRFFERYPEIDVVGGPQLTPPDDKGFAKISGYALTSKFGAWNLSTRYGGKMFVLDADETMLTSANLFCRRYVLEKVKFDPNLFPGEDPKFIEDVKKKGMRVAYSPRIIIYHRRRPTPRSLIKQIYLYGKTRPKKESFFSTLKHPFFLIPSLFVLYLLFLIIASILQLAGIPFFFKETWLSRILIYPLLAYIFLSLLFAVIDSLNNQDFKAVFILPFIYPLIHISYGVGMIIGFLQKPFK